MCQIENTIGITNDGFRQSGVKIKLTLHCTEMYTGPFPYTGIDVLTNFTKHKGGDMKKVLGSADTAILLTGEIVNRKSDILLIVCNESKSTIF